MKYRLGSTVGFLAGVGLAALAGLYSTTTRADDTQGVTGAVRPASSAAVAAHPKHKKVLAVASTGDGDNYSPNKPYFAEFRARNAASYGHFYILYGEVNSRDEIMYSKIAGFFPAGDARDCINCSVFNWTVGHVIFVPSEIGVSDGDLEEKYVTARFRVRLDAAQYKKLVAYIEDKKANRPLWNALWKNCVTFGRDIAAFLDLKLPLLLAIAPSIMIYPKDFVNDLREANGVMHEQSPLKDASGSIGTPTDSVAGAPQRKAKPTANARPGTKASHTPPNVKKPVVSLSNDTTAASNAIH
jgi:hypothetical protein